MVLYVSCIVLCFFDLRCHQAMCVYNYYSKWWYVRACIISNSIKSDETRHTRCSRVHFIVISKCVHFSITFYLNGVARATNVGTLNLLLIEEWDVSNWWTWPATWAEMFPNSLMPCSYHGLLYAVYIDNLDIAVYNSLERPDQCSRCGVFIIKSICYPPQMNQIYKGAMFTIRSACFNLCRDCIESLVPIRRAPRDVIN